MSLDDFMTTREAAKELGMKPGTVTRAVQRGRFEGAIKKDWFWMVPKSVVLELKKAKAK